MKKPLMTYIITYQKRWLKITVKEMGQQPGEVEYDDPKHHQPFTQ